MVEEMELQEVRAYIAHKLSAESFDCLEGLKVWFSKLRIKDWQDHIEFKSTSYNRIPLHAGPLYDLLLICWNTGQASEFHPHPEHGCLVKVLRGSLTEEFKKECGTVEMNEYKTDDTIYICNELGTHRVKNAGLKPVISLHLYAPGDYKP